MVFVAHGNRAMLREEGVCVSGSFVRLTEWMAVCVFVRNSVYDLVSRL